MTVGNASRLLYCSVAVRASLTSRPRGNNERNMFHAVVRRARWADWSAAGWHGWDVRGIEGDRTGGKRGQWCRRTIKEVEVEMGGMCTSRDCGGQARSETRDVV